MNELHLLIDDFRNVGEDVVCRTPHEGKAFLAENAVTHLYIDHDLGPDPDGNEYENGYKVVVWALENGHCPTNVQIVSSNPVGRRNIEAALVEHGYVLRSDHKYWVKPSRPRDPDVSLKEVVLRGPEK